jgi:hypothetical protein
VREPLQFSGRTPVAGAPGMLAIWRRDRNHSGTVEADAVIEELAELLALLGLPDSRKPSAG